MIKILVCGKLADPGLKLLSQEKRFELDVQTEVDAASLKPIIGKYDAMTVRSETLVTKALLSAAKKLKVIVRAGIGVDNVDVEAATQQGILVMNTPLANSTTTAEHAIAMLLSLCRHIPQATQSLKEGRWEKKSFLGVEVFGKTLGLLGLGNVGKIVADRALGLRMKVIAYDPFISKTTAQNLSVELVTEEELYQRADFVSVHMPLTDQTHYFLSKEKFLKMKKGALLVHCARGGIVHEADLADMITRKHISGAALDVFEEEPVRDLRLISLPQVICTPHLGAATHEAQQKVGIETAKVLMDYFKEGIIQNAVNMPSVTQEQLAVLKPYLVLIEKMGNFLGQMMESGNLKAVEIEYSGKVVDLDMKLLTHTFMMQFLRQHLEHPVNTVNALLIAKERGISIKTTISNNTSEFTSLILVKVTGQDHEQSLAGTIFHPDQPRFVRIDQFYLEAIPEGTLLYTKNKDKPGVIGALGTLLGKENINISRFQLGLDEKTKEAVALINIDSPLHKEVLQKISKIPHILRVKQVML
ncbi:MAG: phosphoglycerate dehydrogenase [Deltaproteobacteria bacterium]|nr:phosphoglycerate dehydrogenase [Deltaproteobacteria bacterium]